MSVHYKTGDKQILDLGRNGYDYYNALMMLFQQHYSVTESEWMVQGFYDNTIGQLIRFLHLEPTEVIEYIKSFPLMNDMLELQAILDPIMMEEQLRPVCQEHILHLFLDLRTQPFFNFNGVNRLFIPFKIGFDYVIIQTLVEDGVTLV